MMYRQVHVHVHVHVQALLPKVGHVSVFEVHVHVNARGRHEWKAPRSDITTFGKTLKAADAE